MDRSSPRRSTRRMVAALCLCAALPGLASCAREPSVAPSVPPASGASTADAVAPDPSLDATRVTVFEAKATQGFGSGASTATLEYSLPGAGHVRIVVFDVGGRELGRVMDGWRPEGRHSVDFAIGGGRRQVSFYRIEWGGQTLTGRIVAGP